MSYQIYAGYSGLFRPPTENLCKYGTSLYCVTTDSKRTLLVVALNPTFFVDLYRIIKHPQYQKLILIVPSTDCMYISDIYNLYSEVTTHLGKQFELICPEEIITPTSDQFLSRVRVGNKRITLFHNEEENLVVTIDFNHQYTPRSREVWDIILTTPIKRIFFSFYMSLEKLKWLKENHQFFDEIHMPFTNISYGGASYMEVARMSCSGIVPQIRVHSFRTEEEMNYCKNHGIPYGGLIYNDLV